MSSQPKKLAILAAGGPAPGINSVISAAAIRAILDGTEVLGIKDGFKYLMQGRTDQIVPLTIADVSRVHFRGGSFIGIARDNPTKNPEHLQTVIDTLLSLGVDKLITVGGDDTAFTAHTISEKAKGQIRVVHVPKTIDNDLDLPHGIPTFGFQTARHIGVEIVKNLMTDAKTTSRWYFVISMGRSAGHLALGIGKSAGATISLIPEDFIREGERISLKEVVDILVGSIIKRKSEGHENGVAVLAEGIVEHMDLNELGDLSFVERDEHDNIRLAEVNFGEIIKYKVQERLKQLEVKATIVSKNIGYELRCCDPIPFDMEYCRDLGYMAAKFIHHNGTGALVSMQNGHFVPMYFKDILNPKTGRMKIRMVDTTSDFYEVAQQYMIRLTKEDFQNEAKIEEFAKVAKLPVADFKEMFEYLVKK